jgi:hypothetical protein
MAEIFKGDWSTGDKSQYQLEQAPPEEHVPPSAGSTSVVVAENGATVFPGSGLKYTCKFVYKPGDAQVPANAGKRSELQRPNPFINPGTHLWLDEWIRVDSRLEPYMVLRQLHEEEEATGVAAGLYLEGTNELKLKAGVGSSWWINTIELGVAFHLKIHVFIHHSEGIVEVWKNGVKQTLQNGQQIFQNINTLDASSVAVGKTATKVYDKIGLLGSKEATGEGVVYHGGTRLFDADPGETKPASEEGGGGSGKKMELWPTFDTGAIAIVDPGAEATTLTGWTVGENDPASVAYKTMAFGEKRSASGWGGTPLPNANPGVTSNDTLWTPEKLTKNFKAGNWLVALKEIAAVLGGTQDGHPRVRLWKSPDKVAFTALGAAFSLTDVTNLAVGAAQESSGSLAAEVVKLENEFLGIQIAWQITGKATGATSDVLFRKGSAIKITTPEEEAAVSSGSEIIKEQQYQPLAGRRVLLDGLIR